MANKGFISSAEAVIRQIKENLREGRYSLEDGGFPIVKELLQNSDDARATEMHLGWSGPLQSARHPLLNGPGLFVVNNGQFRGHDAKNIRRFGENTKAIETASIGKFGLGLKSIFHLCEAFFFMASSRDETGQRIDFADIVNPWSDESENSDEAFHSEWDSFCDQDRQAMLARLRPLLEHESWFCLWIPLRQRSQLSGNEPIIHYFPGEDLASPFSHPDLPFDIARSLPLLAHLQIVKGWQTQGQQPDPQFTVALSTESARRQPVDELADTRCRPLMGTVDVARDSRNTTIVFAGDEINPGDTQLAQLKDHGHWPSDLGRDATGRARQIKEKALQHAGVCLTFRRNAGTTDSRMSIRWAVFLPLGEPETVPLRLPGIEVSLLLHGYFFVDAGRNRVVGVDGEEVVEDELNNDEHVRFAWNRRLAEVGTLPLVPQALARLVQESTSAITEQETSALTAAIERSTFFQRFRHFVCSQFSWARLYQANGFSRWELFPTQGDVLSLPHPSDDGLPWAVFPAMATLAGQVRIAFGSVPHLLQHDLSRWDFDLTEILLESVPPEKAFEDDRCLGYLNDFLDECADNQAWSLHATTLTKIARAGLCGYGLSRLREHPPSIRRYVQSLPSDRRLALAFPATSSANELFGELCGQDVDVVFIPTELVEPEYKCTGRLANDTAVHLLMHLSSWQRKELTSSDREMVALVAAQLLQGAADRQQVLATCARLGVFVGRECRDRTEIVLSWNQLNDRLARRLLFANPPSYAYQLQAALAGERVLLISKALFEYLFPEQSPPFCREKQILETLRNPNRPAFSPATTRIGLLDILLGYQAGRTEAQFRECIRLLLHGEPSHFDTQAELLVARAGRADVWFRATHIALGKLGATWRLLDVELSDRLSGEQRREFGVDEVGVDPAVALMLGVGPDAFGELEPSPTEYSELLHEIANDDLCRQLPVHEDVDGRRVAIGSNCYWESEIELPDDLRHSVTLLRRSSSQPTWNRQRQLAEVLDALATIEIVLDQADPGRFWQVLMDSIERAQTVSSELWQRISKAEWLPTQGLNYTRPENVIHLPHLVDEVARATATMPGVFYAPGSLRDDLRSHRAYRLLQSRAFPARESALAMLGDLLIEEPENKIGNIPEGMFEDWLAALTDVSPDAIPSYEVVCRASEQYSNEAICLFKKLSCTTTNSQIIAVLDYLETRHKRVHSRTQKEQIVGIFNEYLRNLVTPQNYVEQLQTLVLPTQRDTWRSPAELCFDAEGIASECIVNASTAAVLREAVPGTESEATPVPIAISGMAFAELKAIERLVEGDSDPAVSLPAWRKQWEAAAEKLDEFFQAWRGTVCDEEIGGFLSLLGDDPNVVALAGRYLGHNRSVAQTRSNLGVPDGIQNLRVVVGVSRGETATVRNLIGDFFNAQKSKGLSTLFVGFGTKQNPFPRHWVLGHTVICLCLNEIDVNEHQAELGRLLRVSAVRFLNVALGETWHGERSTRVDGTWEDLSQSDQLDVRIAEARVIANGFLILEQLGLRSHPRIAAVLNKWDYAQRLQAEQGAFSSVSFGQPDGSADRQMEEAKQELRRLLVNDEEVQSCILDAIRQRIAQHYQYTAHSVPFEVFQNADDASVELVRHFDVSADAIDAGRDFQVCVFGDRVVFAHFGRRINQYPVDDSDPDLGFDDDLWKMLVLSLSNKLYASDGRSRVVTGKFGLGFKSVYLVSQRPRLLSGRLAFEIRGAMYPRRLDGSERASLEELRRRYLGDRREATIIELLLESEDAASDSVSRFFSLAHLQVIFGKHIRRCVVNDAEDETAWDPREIRVASGCFVGRLKPLRQVSVPDSPTHALLLSTPHGSALFGIGARQLEFFGPDVPTIWVTAPTQEVLDLGFLINGPFSLDVGRAQLTRDYDQNRTIAAAFGRMLAERLCELAAATESSEGWAALRSELELADNADKYGFWESCWQILGIRFADRMNRQAPADTLINDIFWSESDRAAAALYAKYPVLPSALRGDYRRLVLPRRVRFAVKGTLTETEGLFERVFGWTAVREHAPPETVISHDGARTPLSRLRGDLISHAASLDLATVLQWEFERGPFADVEKSARLGQVITKRLVEQIRDRAESERVRDLLDSIEFKGADQRYHPAKQLLIGHETDAEREHRPGDEQLRARFAPPSTVLSDEYVDAAIQFFNVCRGSLEAPVRQMAAWVLNATGLAQRSAALTYVANGALGSALADHLVDHGMEGTWLADLVNTEAFKSLKTQTKMRLSCLLSEDCLNQMEQTFSATTMEPITRQLTPDNVLAAIHDWWMKERHRRQDEFDGRTLIDEYERRVYPNGRPLALDPGDALPNVECRRDWMTLLLLGLTHTIGRTTYDQHRGFLSKCDREGWLDMFANSHQDSERWIGFARDYLRSQVDDAPYLTWMNRFIGIFQVSFWLDDYIELLLSANRFNRSYALTELLQPLGSPEYRGGGVGAPPLLPLLGVGACFVMRELTRFRIIDNQCVLRHCFVPVKRIRDLFGMFRCDGLDLPSRRWEMASHIYRFVVDSLGTERATFGGDFDIPFLFIAENVALQHRFFRQELPYDENDQGEADAEP